MKCNSLNPGHGFGWTRCEFRAAFEDVLAEHNVSITRSLPYTPQLNGKAKASWRVFNLRNRATRVSVATQNMDWL